MKINLKPVVEMTNEEKETLRAFAIGFNNACDDVSDCNDCPLHALREDFDLNDSCSAFISRMIYTLGIY